MSTYGPYIAAAGTAANVAGEQQAASQRRSILNSQMDRNERTQRETTQQLLDEGRKFRAEDRLASMQQQEGAQERQALADVGTGAAASIPQAAGDVSAAYAKAKADRALSEGMRLSAIAREVAKTRAPGSLQNDEALRRANLTGDVASKWSTTRNMGQAAELDAQAVEAPWWGQLGKLASAVGTAAMMAPAAAPGAGGVNYSLAGGGAKLGTSSAPGFWSGASRIRFGG
jgi:hypothetical protein